MLTRLDILNVVLIDRLSLAGESINSAPARGGLVALTGETGAGKSILLDALGLTLGARADAGLLRHGADQASVTASFDLPAQHPLHAFLKEKGLAAEDTVILRRTLGKDGRSKAFINDSAVSIQTLKEAGALLIEIHGQFETQGLLDPATHIDTLDAYAGIDPKPLEKSWEALKTAKDRLNEAVTGIEAMRMQEQYLKHAVAELEDLDPKAGEETILAEKRRFLMEREKMAGAYEQATSLLEGDDGLQSMMGRLQASLERLADDELRAGLSRAKAEIDELAWQVERRRSGKDSEDSLEEIEERYFKIRACAKKHRCDSDALPDILAEMSQKLRLITHHDDALAELKAAVDRARTAFAALAEKTGEARKKAAQKLVKSVNAELPDLKLDKAAFSIDISSSREEENWNARGFDRVQFMAATNPGMPPAPLHKTASGGELSRFMLALKVILAETGSVPTLIFDEVDSGIGGATADAVGERLQRLAKKYQVLVVTHSPQVAARARHHWHVAKTGQKGTVVTQITPLQEISARTEEIARMLSGAEITKEARAQAGKLLKNQNAA